MSLIPNDTLGPTNQLLLTEKSSAADQLDTPNEPLELQTDPASHISATLKGIPGYNHFGLND